MTRKPDLFIVGARKCGTTAMHHYLRQHPEVYLPEVKEPNYWSSDLDVPRLVDNLEDYLRLFDDAGDATIVGEASPRYLISEAAAKRIKAFNPDARALIMLRNPVDQMHARHSQMVFGGGETEEDFQAALERDEARKRRHAKGELPPGQRPHYYRETATFSPQVARYLDAFGRDRVKVALLDDLKADAAGLYRDVCAFLGVDATFEPGFPVVNANTRARSGLVKRALKPNSPHGLLARRFLARHPTLRRVAKRIYHLNTKETTRAPMDPALRARLLDEFAPEIERLGRLIDRDLTPWIDDQDAPPATREAGP